VHGVASFGDIITRDGATRLHLVAAGQVGNDAAGLIHSQMLWAAIGALAQSYDYLVIDAGAQSETAVAPIAMAAPFAVLVGGDAPANSLKALAAQLRSAGFIEVAMLAGAPPELEQAAVQSAA
jgi:MinD-like ATPase involved in chromosome partitioning or flagellar assembly